MTTRPLIHPTIHLNGSSVEALLTEVNLARRALHAALEALGNMTIHDRDYYPQGPDVGAAARDQQRLRTARVLGVLTEIEVIQDGLLDAQAARNRSRAH